VWIIEPEVRQQVETALGSPIPDPSTPEFERLLAHLQQTRPELARTLLEATRVASNVMLPSEAHAYRMQHRRVVRDLLVRCFYKPVWPEGLVLDKRRVLGFALVLFAVVFLPAIYLLNSAATARHVGGHQLVPDRGAASSAGEVPIAAAQTGPETPRGVSPRLAPSSAATPTLPIPLPGPLNGQLPDLSVPLPAAIHRFPPALSPSAPTAEGLPLQQNLAEGTALRVLAFATSEDRPPSTRIFAFIQPDGTNHEESVRADGRPGPSLTASAQTSSVPLPIPDTDGVPQSVGPPRPPGMRVGEIISARLMTGVALAPGLEPSPLLAVSDAPRWCGSDRCPQVIWLGHATYAGGHRVQIQISSALMEGRTYAIRAVVLGPDMVTGLPAAVSTKTAPLAAQVVTAALAAANDYIQSLGQQQRVTITQEWLTVTPAGSPDLLMHLLGRIGELIGASSGRGATVEVAEVAPTTELRLFILAVEGR